MNNTKELIPTEIASMSEVVVEYMGYKYNAIVDIDISDCAGIYHRCKVFAKIPVEVDSYPEEDKYYIVRGWFNKANENGGYLIYPDYLDWRKIHEVWEKVREDDKKYGLSKILCKSSVLIGAVKISLLNGTPLEVFTALYNAIEFINNLKQENNGTNI